MSPDFFPDPGGNEDENQDPVVFFSEDIDFELSNSVAVVRWIQSVITREACTLDFLNFIFCSDTHLHRMNLEYLQHDDLTDVITFPYADPPVIQGDIFISIDRVRENAGIFNVPFDQELHRVMIHGVLHLCGYLDKKPAERSTMKLKEEEALNSLPLFLSA